MRRWMMTRRDKRLGFVVGDYAVAGIEQVCRAGRSWFAGLEGAVQAAVGVLHVTIALHGGAAGGVVVGVSKVGN